MTASTHIKKYSEKDLIWRQSKYLFRIKNLIQKKHIDINEIGDCLNYLLHVNKRGSLLLKYVNAYGTQMVNTSLETILIQGIPFQERHIEARTISNTKKLMKQVYADNDDKKYVFYYQNIRNSEKSDYQLRLTSRCIIDDFCFLSITTPLNEITEISTVSEHALEPDFEVENHFLILQSLTKREKEILSLVGKGFTSKRISEMLFISIFTVSVHRKNILKKLMIRNNAQLYRMAGLIDRL